MLPMLRTVLGNLLKRPATVSFPAGPKNVCPNARGHVAINIDQCIFCGICARKCPTGAITVDRAAKRWTIRPHECVVCGSCVEACPKKCLDMAEQATLAGKKKAENSFVKAEESPANA